MSTFYYALVEGITSLRLETKGDHDNLSVWHKHGLAGTLTVDLGAGKDLLWLFVDREECPPPLHSHWGGERGTVVTINRDLPDDATVVSEYGEIMTVRDVKARHGAKRKDGMPTELMGFES